MCQRNEFLQTTVEVSPVQTRPRISLSLDELFVLHRITRRTRSLFCSAVLFD